MSQSATISTQTPATGSVGGERPLRIGFLGLSAWTIGSRGNGVIAQAKYQAAALQRAGHEVHLLDMWKPTDPSGLDVVQFFIGGYGTHMIETVNHELVKELVFAPIIDSNEPNWKYRLAAKLGTLHPKFTTVPGMFRIQGRASDLVIARSEHERARVVDGLGVDPSKVEIVLNGVDPPPSSDPTLARRALGLPDEYALHVSIYHQERKNVANLIRAVGPTGVPLVIAGAATASAELDAIKALAEQHRNVKLLGFLDKDVLASLYAGARVFCLPSEHEGTGLVALEAATHGAAVMITANGGTRDYFIDLAEYVDPKSVEGIRAAFERAWNRPRDGRLREHVLKNLTWDQSAAALVRAYRKHTRAAARGAK